MLNQSDIDRFWAKVDRGAPDVCWRWTSAATPAGYGKMGIRYKTHYAHHLAMIMDGRPRPADAIALHACDNPSCVNPRHLSWGTQRDNMRDALRKGRAPHKGRVAGEKNGNAKITAKEVISIRQETGSNADVGKKYGLAEITVSHIRARRSWQHL